ncbi:MAG: L-aspartate semialdehyde sulfurtransferase ferredoxin [Actinomycetota bacterium]|jgi:ABC-type methionine transport system ATPase subunit|nr:L-aspartate semialdehyde sulfurtransferase ferredoxin [Actinomycetota bacterium]
MNSARVKLTFPEHLIKQPVIARLVREFDIMPNIRQAKIEETVGWVVCELTGEDGSIDRAIDWLRELGVEVDRLGDVLES